jgi:hypothetical protein
MGRKSHLLTNGIRASLGAVERLEPQQAAPQVASTGTADIILYLLGQGRPSWLINLRGRVYVRSSKLVVRLGGGHPSTEILLEARRMLCLCNSG